MIKKMIKIIINCWGSSKKIKGADRLKKASMTDKSILKNTLKKKVEGNSRIIKKRKNG